MLSRIVAMFSSGVATEKIIGRGQNPDRFSVRYLRCFNRRYKSKARLPSAVNTVDWPISGSDIGRNGTYPHCSSALILLIFSDSLENTYLALLPQLPSNGLVTLSNNLPAMDCL